MLWQGHKCSIKDRVFVPVDLFPKHASPKLCFKRNIEFRREDLRISPRYPAREACFERINYIFEINRFSAKFVIADNAQCEVTRFLLGKLVMR